MIDQNVIDKIIFGVDIVTEIESEGVKLTKRGTNYEGCCPFHREKTPSFKVSRSKNIFKCFGCNEAGNVIQFVQKKHNMTFPEAVEYLAGKHGIEYQRREMSPEEREAAHKREQLYTINKVALDYFIESYKKDQKAQQYAESRWDLDTIEKYQIGYAPDDWQGFLNYARGLGYKDTIMQEADLIKEGERSPYDTFRGRIMFPVRGRTGNIVGFSGRIIKESKDPNKRPPKYLNTRDTAIFHKKENLFGLFEAQREIRATKRVNLVEGNPDVIRMFERGVFNTVAPLGTALTQEHIELLRRQARSVILIGDTDEAGIKAIEKNGELLFRAGLNVSVMNIPTGKDPDEYFKDKSHEYEDALTAHTIDYVEFVAARKLYDVTSTADKAQAIGEVCELIMCCPDESTIDMYIDKLGQRFKPKSAWSKKLSEVRNQREMEQRIKGKGDDSDMWTKYGFSTENNCYWGSGKRANEKWSNFVMKPIAHIRSLNNSKRLYVITNQYGHEQTIELRQEELVSLPKFRVRVESAGNFLWEAGEAELFKLKNYLYQNTETCDEITQLGWQKRYGFFAWGNGGFVDGRFVKADEIGIVRIGDKSYYLPAFSKIFKYEDKMFQFERKFIHVKSNDISMREYLTRMIGVYGDNGKVAFCFLLGTLFKDIVTSHTKSFPILNLFGPKGSGKTELGGTLTSFFIPNNIALNINSTTIPALAEAVAQVSNAVVHIDEYKNSIDLDRREFLKGLWDGTGRSRMNMDRDKKREMTTVDSGVVLSGQEMPTADIALFSRTISLTFYKTVYSEEESNAFNALKLIEGRGLSHLTNEILCHRGRMETLYRQSLETVMQDMRVRLEGETIESRTLNNWITILAVMHCLAPVLDLPFTYEDMFVIARQGLIDQNQKTQQSGELAGFWETVENLVRSAQLFNGIDFHIKHLKREVKIQQSNNVIMPDPSKQYLLISFNRIAQLYLKDGKSTGDKRIPKDSLKHYLEHSNEFIGTLRSVRFKAMDTPTGYVREKLDYMGQTKEVKSIVTTAMAFDYELLQANFNININDYMCADSEDVVAEDQQPKVAIEPVQQKVPF